MNQYTKSGLPFDLSPKEMEVCKMLCQDMTNMEVGKAMHLSAKTIATYKYRAFKKAGVHTIIGLYKKLYPMKVDIEVTTDVCILCKQAMEKMDET